MCYEKIISIITLLQFVAKFTNSWEKFSCQYHNNNNYYCDLLLLSSIFVSIFLLLVYTYLIDDLLYFVPCCFIDCLCVKVGVDSTNVPEPEIPSPQRRPLLIKTHQPVLNLLQLIASSRNIRSYTHRCKINYSLNCTAIPNIK